MRDSTIYWNLGEHFPQCWFRDKPVCQVHLASFFTLFVSLIYFSLPVILTLPQSVCSHAHKGSLIVKQFGQQLLHNKYHTGFLFLNRLCSISENSNIYLVASIVAAEMLVLTVSCTQTGLVLIRLSFVYLTYWTVLTQVKTCTCFPPVLKNRVGVINVLSCLQYALIVCISEPIPPSVNSSICSLSGSFPRLCLLFLYTGFTCWPPVQCYQCYSCCLTLVQFDWFVSF